MRAILKLSHSIPCLFNQAGDRLDNVRLYRRRRHTVGMLRIMSRRGDDRVAWDATKVNASDPEAVAAVLDVCAEVC